MLEEIVLTIQKYNSELMDSLACLVSFASRSQIFCLNLGSICAENLKNCDISPCAFLAITAQFPLSSAVARAKLSSNVSPLT